MTPADIAARQEFFDRFYFSHGKCCAGCDLWRSINSMAGECLHSKIVSGHERGSMLDMSNPSINIGAGHALTVRDHVCANFKDDFDWLSLSPWYLRAIGHSGT